MARRRTTPPVTDPLLYRMVTLALLLIFLPWIGRILLLIVAGALVIAYLRRHNRQMLRLHVAGIDDIDRMDGKAFEQRLWLLFTKLGYRVEQTPYSGDYGADLIIERNNVRSVVQAKRYSKPVGLSAVQESFTAMARYGCSNAIVVTNRTFTKQAKELAHNNKVELWERERLIDELVRSQRLT
jgi:restriction system protein